MLMKRVMSGLVVFIMLVGGDIGLRKRGELRGGLYTYNAYSDDIISSTAQFKFT